MKKNKINWDEVDGVFLRKKYFQLLNMVLLFGVLVVFIFLYVSNLVTFFRVYAETGIVRLFVLKVIVSIIIICFVIHLGYKTFMQKKPQFIKSILFAGLVFVYEYFLFFYTRIILRIHLDSDLTSLISIHALLVLLLISQLIYSTNKLLSQRKRS
ncbi:hypothetical protein AYK26_05785 [Euryarchaeota archaeon SM23-78]|nr:MAG: hypothetical protein AYK26_05785 [Euryarchaeota archaeon SM23-78]MBW3000980.1 hypothetical protein [Candidatus Woesearchaeota archaeon]